MNFIENLRGYRIARIFEIKNIKFKFYDNDLYMMAELWKNGSISHNIVYNVNYDVYANKGYGTRHGWN
jgi:hypothetical protein